MFQVQCDFRCSGFGAHNASWQIPAWCGGPTENSNPALAVAGDRNQDLGLCASVWWEVGGDGAPDAIGPGTRDTRTRLVIRRPTAAMPTEAVTSR